MAHLPIRARLFAGLSQQVSETISRHGSETCVSCAMGFGSASLRPISPRLVLVLLTERFKLILKSPGTLSASAVHTGPVRRFLVTDAKGDVLLSPDYSATRFSAS